MTDDEKELIRLNDGLNRLFFGKEKKCHHKFHAGHCVRCGKTPKQARGKE